MPFKTPYLRVIRWIGQRGYHICFMYEWCWYSCRSIWPGSIEDEDAGNNNDDDLNDNTDDLDCTPPLTRLSNGDIEEALDKLQDLSLFSSYRDESRSLTLKIETFLNKERTEDLIQSHFTVFFQVVNQIAGYTDSLYGRFYIELTKNVTYDNDLVICIV